MKPSQIGNIVTGETHGKRDATHVPVVLVISDKPLLPGSRVIFTDSSCLKVVPVYSGSVFHAVADPFIPGAITPGQQFWVMVAPGFTGPVAHHFTVTIPELRSAPSEAETEAEHDDWCRRECY